MDLKNAIGEVDFWGTWFTPPVMDKTPKNGLSMSEMDPLNHKWFDFVI